MHTPSTQQNLKGHKLRNERQTTEKAVKSKSV